MPDNREERNWGETPTGVDPNVIPGVKTGSQVEAAGLTAFARGARKCVSHGSPAFFKCVDRSSPSVVQSWPEQVS